MEAISKDRKIVLENKLGMASYKDDKDIITYYDYTGVTGYS